MSVLDYRSAAAERSGLSRTGDWLGWAVYLGMSWTWCIGMFLPVLLVRDYGFWAWVIFAVPNVVGAAAMGWVLKDGDSEMIVANHSRAISMFSIATAAFQIYFLRWIFTWYLAPHWFAPAVALTAMMLILINLRDGMGVIIAVIVCFISLICMNASGWTHDLFWFFGRAPLKPPSDVIALVPLCLFGFALNPYLDRTFHLARQRMNDRAAKAAFSIGFGVLFSMMIVFSLIYAQRSVNSFSSVWVGKPFTIICIHWSFQLAFTIAAHLASARKVTPRQSGGYAETSASIVLAAIAIFLITRIDQHQEIDAGEIIYRCFLGFYGLIFPGYVWLCMIPGRGRTGPSKRQWLVLAVVSLAAAPMFWMAFIERKMIWAIPGVAVVLIGRVFIPKQRAAIVNSSVAAAV